MAAVRVKMATVGVKMAAVLQNGGSARSRGSDEPSFF